MTILNRILWLSFLGGIAYSSAFGLLHFDISQKTWYERKKERLLLGLAFGNAGIIIVIGEIEGRTLEICGKYSILYTRAEEVLLSLLAGGLLAAAYMDAKSCYVYNYVWWWCLPWAMLLLCLPRNGQPSDIVAGMIFKGISTRQAAAMAIFVILQQWLFARMYGRADSHAFTVCALTSCRWRGEMLWFLIHMLLAVTLLAIIQLKKGNVTWRGKLRTPEPFVPYIIITFWLEILCMLLLR